MMISKLFNTANEEKYGKTTWPIVHKESYLEFTNPQQAKNWGMSHYEQWSKLYKKQVESAEQVIKTSLCATPIEYYCGESYRDINEYLRQGTDTEKNLHRELSDLLSFVLCGAPKIPCNLVLYRMVCDDFIHTLIEKNKQSAPCPAQEMGFMSTSLLKSITNQPEGYAAEKNLLKIYVPKDTIGIYVNAVTTRSEEEMLLLHGMFLGLAAYPYQDKESGKTIYECNLLPRYI